MNKYPMKLTPVPREMIWGGGRLKSKYNKDASFEKLGESWELTVRPEAQSVIANGEYEGQLLKDVIGVDSFDFPLLIKFIDANDRLSVQVHPDDDITDESGNPLGKTEMWYIIEAEEGSHLIYGINDGTTVEEFACRVNSDDFEGLLKKVEVKAGDCFFIPAGQVHAIGEGILLAEIQQNSDTTYRLYDYGRLDKNGKSRELHTEKALSVIKARSDSSIEKLRYKNGSHDNCLCDCDKFSCYKYTTSESSELSLPEADSFSALVFVEGKGKITCNGIEYSAMGGDTFYIPEGLSLYISGDLTLLKACVKG
ncbi:MAG: class I mannose-6-phosphate isomerase [Clostridia bacterium]|nr:class I mannose-6-phosphate isomerase [Clostridia bacterium]